MKRLKIVAFGTKNYVEKYSNNLKNDCEKLKYSYKFYTIPDYNNISEINFRIREKIVNIIKETDPNDRILFLDPECRIHKQIPNEWIDSDKPVVFYKVEPYQNEISQYRYGQWLPCAVIMQPFFASSSDANWLDWWLKISNAMSRPETNDYTPNELFFELAMDYHKIDRIKQTIIYNREWSGKHICTKGTYTTEDTIFTHQSIHAALDNEIFAANQKTRDNSILPLTMLHNHFQDYNTIKKVDELMLKEIVDINLWPKETQKIRINTTNWYALENWLFDPHTGRIKYIDYPTIKYHYSLERKLKLKLKTPVTKYFLDSQEKRAIQLSNAL